MDMPKLIRIEYEYERLQNDNETIIPITSSLLDDEAPAMLGIAGLAACGECDGATAVSIAWNEWLRYGRKEERVSRHRLQQATRGV